MKQEKEKEKKNKHTSGKTSSEAEKKYVWTMSSEATSLYFSCKHQKKKKNTLFLGTKEKH